jgi:serine phosphatase RsbU (regulator of sigma subunit)
VALVIGDVQGHDITAAAVMGQLRTALRAYVSEGHSPSDVMGRASVFLHDLDTDLMATCTCVLLDPATGDGQIVRAGHPHPIIRAAGRRAARVEAAGGVPLGLPQYAGSPYPTTHINLGAGDTLMLCTDGLLETREADLEAGERRIAASWEQGSQDLEVLADRIIATTGNRQGNEDDIALLMARRTSTRSHRPAAPL